MDFLQTLEPYFADLLGINVDPRSLTPLQVSARAVVIYLVGLVILRIGDNRFLGRHTAFDIILAFLLGALLSRSVNGSGPFLPTILAVALLVTLHWLFGWVATRWSGFANLLRGRSIALVEEGEMNEKVMHRHLISRSDLREAMRLSGQPGEAPIGHAYLERNGSISIVPMGAADFEGSGSTRHQRGSGGRIGPEPENPEQEGSRRHGSQDTTGRHGGAEGGNGGGEQPAGEAAEATVEAEGGDSRGGRPRVLEIDVAEGVQTVRVVLE